MTSPLMLKRRREKLSETIRRVRTSGTGGITHVLMHPAVFVLSERTGTWTREIGEATGFGPTADAHGVGEIVTLNDARNRIVKALEVEEAEVLAKLRGMRST